jgi:hypothetical protein
VHRDIKPSNIILGEYGEVTVLDWGTALDCEQPPPSTLKAVGTPLYMAPEQAQGATADERSDVYCLGGTLWHLLTLERPLAVSPGADNADFWEAKFAGKIPEPPAGVPAALIGIARRALSLSPCDRYQTVAELREELRTWQRQKTSLAFCERGEAALGASAEATDYAYFARVEEDFRRALEEWPENERAQTGLSAAQAAHARFALRRGDLELALEITNVDDPQHAEVRREVALLREKQSEARRRVRRMRAVLAAVALLVAGLVSFLVYDWHRTQGAWHTEYVYVPSQGLPPLKATSDQRGTELVLKQGAVELPGGQLFYLEGVRVRSNVRVEIELEWLDQVDGFEIVVKSRHDKLSSWWLLPAGYSCQFGGYNGTVSFISQNREASVPGTADSIYIPFVPKRRYRLAYSVIGDEAALLVDGVERLRVRSMLPLGNSSFEHIALRAWSGVVIHRIEVSRQALPEKPGPLLAGDVLAAAGNLADATRTYQEIAADFPQSKTAERALARACLAAASVEELRSERKALLDKLIAEYPESHHRQRCEEFIVRDAWSNGKIEEALRGAEQILERFPTSRIAIQLVDGIPKLGKAETKRLLALVGRTRDIARLYLGWLDIEDFSVLARSDLVDVTLDGTRITDLSPLAQAKLRKLSLRHTKVHDLSPLRGMPLEHLELERTQVSDLGPLKGAPLSRLGIARTAVMDLEPMRGAQLKTVDVRGSKVSDLGPLAGMPLWEVLAGDTKVSDISALKNTPVRVLELDRTNVTDLGPLANNRTFERIVLTGSPVMDLAPLAGMTIGSLILDFTKVPSLAPLGTASLGYVSLQGVAADDLIGLRGATMAILGHNGAYRLAPLVGSKLVRLEFGPCRIKDPLALLELPELEWLTVLEALSEDQLTALIRAMERRGARATLIQALREQLLFMQGDPAALRLLAKQGPRGRVLLTPKWASPDEASAIVAKLGARFPNLADKAMRDFVVEHLAHGAPSFLDVQVRGGRPFWGDGAPVDPELFEPEEFSDLVDGDAIAAVWVGERLYLRRVGTTVLMSGRIMAFWPD